MSNWRPIEDAPHDRPILVRGGELYGSTCAYESGILVAEYFCDSMGRDMWKMSGPEFSVVEMVRPTEYCEIPD